MIEGAPDGSERSTVTELVARSAYAGLISRTPSSSGGLAHLRLTQTFILMRLALAGDAMLGRGVGERLPAALFSEAVVAIAREADLFVLNLECCISDRGSPFPGRVFHFRAPPAAADALAALGVDCVTLANNHALDFGPEALEDSCEHLRRVGIRWVAREPVILDTGSFRLAVVGLTDHPCEYQGHLAYADLGHGHVPEWTVPELPADAVLVTPHWGPNLAPQPVSYVRRAARRLLERGATLVAGHSAHVFHGVEGSVLYDLGDFVDDYRTDPLLRNDLGLLWLVELDAAGPKRVEAVPLKLDHCYTRLADGDDAAWIRRRFRSACAALGTTVGEEDGRLVVSF
jgi:poly-gamma-glutamate synthesis protein (capsule biosynthesis protein)